MESNTFVLRGSICYSKNSGEMVIHENGYVVCEDGICRGVYEKLPEMYQGLPLTDYGNRLIIPGMIDLHVHAPQYPFRGLGMDLELIEWLNTHTFPEETKYRDLEYAKRAYEMFVKELMQSTTTRACIFATIHTQATLLLMDMLERAGFSGYVGKVNMDRNSPESLCEKDAVQSAEDTKAWIQESFRRFHRIKPMLTPRFVPSCTDDLMGKLEEIQKKYELPVQSHLSENLGEIQWVQELCPDTECYGDAYDRFGMFGKSKEGKEVPVIMAHCVHSGEKERRLLKEQGVYVAHCPQSNTNLSSGIAPIRQYLNQGIRVGLGSDVAGGHNISILQAMAEAIQVSKLRWRLVDQESAPLKIEEVFYMATKGGGAFFGKVGSFEPDYEFDAVVLEDEELLYPQELTVRERLERMIYLADGRQVKGKYIQGRKIF